MIKVSFLIVYTGQKILLRSLRSLVRDPSLFLPLLILVMALPFFFIGGPTWMSGPLFRALWDLGHLIFFATLLMAIQQKHPLASWRWWLTVTIAVFLVGAMIEYVQSKVGRDGNWGDILNNVTGAWLGLFWFQKARPLVWIGRVLALILMIPPLLIVIKLAVLQYQVAQDFPLLAGFEHEFDPGRWDGDVKRSSEYVSQGKYSLAVTLGNQEYPKAALRKFFGDWRHHQQLAFDIYNPARESIAMTLRVHDAEHELGKHESHDRFNIRFIVEPGWNHYQFNLNEIAHAPRGRKMKMDLIRGIEIYSARLSPERTIYLDNLRLQ